ncbi:hypothetical protein LJC61_02655 [Ruminococcaceae bacterium OttesenSCG-928-A16]|nr:hypothetical protein [Ruminococcaceae bacterium OttesenSCG-928-A16]
MKKIVTLILTVAIVGVALVGCREASRVSYNVSQQADNFNVTRRLVVLNGRTDTIIYEMVGRFSFELEGSRIILIVESEKGVYKKISVGLPQEAFWFVDDISGADVNQYRYEVNFLPQMIVPIDFISED